MSEINDFLNGKTGQSDSPKTSEIDNFLNDGKPQGKGIGGHVQDTAVSLLGSTVGAVDAVVGLADIPTGGKVGKFLENKDGMLGLRTKEASDIINSWHTDQYKQQQKDFSSQQGIVDKAKFALQNPSLLTNSVVESAPSMVLGGTIGRGLGLATKAAPVLAGAIGEGLVSGGQAAEQMRHENADGLLTGKNIGAALGTVGTTSGFSMLGGKLANKLGVDDFETAMARQGASATQKPLGLKNYAKAIGGGALSEGAFEELPQSVTEQMWQNYGQDKPLMEGTADAAVMGALTGGLMGGGINAARGVTFKSNDTDATDQTPSDNATPYAQSGTAEVIDPNTPQLEYTPPQPPQGIPYAPVSDTFNVSPDGVVFGDENINEYLQGKQAQDEAMRRAGMPSDINDITPVPTDAQGFNADILTALPAPTNNFTVDGNGNVLTTADLNSQLEKQRQADIERRNRIASGMPNDATAIPQEPTGFGVEDNATPALPYKNDIMVDSQGNAYAGDQINEPLQSERQQNIENLANRLRGKGVNDITPVPSEAQGFTNDTRTPAEKLGIDPNQGGLSSAAAVAVDTGASPITAELQRQATQSQPNEQANWLNGIAIPTAQNQNEAPQLGYSPSENTETPPAQQVQVADLWNSQDPQQRMAILGGIYGNEDMARQNALASFDRLPKPAQQQIADIAVQNGAVSEDNNTQSSNGQTTQTAPQAPLTALAQDIAPASQANAAPAIEPILGKDGKNKWFATQNKADEFIQKKSLGDNYTIEQTGKMRYEIVPKVQEQAPIQEPQRTQQERRQMVIDAYNTDNNPPADAGNYAQQKAKVTIDRVKQQSPSLYEEARQLAENAEVATNKTNGRTSHYLTFANDDTYQADPFLGKKPSKDEIMVEALMHVTRDNAPMPPTTNNTEATQPKLYGKESYIQTGSERQPTRVAVVEADSLAPDDKNTDNQFRDRTRSASQMQIDSIANNLDPRQLTDSTTMATGSPTLANDGKTIIAGNGRTKAIKQAYAQGKGAEYKQSLIEQAQSLGIDPQQIAGMKNPVLVKEFTNPVDVKKMAIESNATGGLAMSAKEQARADSALLPDVSMLASDDKGNINLSRNAHIFRKFISSLPVEAQASMLDKDGLLSKEGLSRLQNAVLYKAYGDSKTFDDMVENTDVDVKNAINGLTQVAPKIAQTKESINKGTSYDADISDDITAALSLLQQIRKNEMSVSDYLSQMGLFDDGLSPIAKEFIQYIDANIRSAKAIADLLSAYYDNLDKLGNPNQQDLLGGKPNTDKQSLFKQALERVRNAKQPTKQQTDLFSQSDADSAGQPTNQADNAVEQRPSQSQSDGAGVGTNESAKPSDEQVKTALKELVSDDVWSGKKALIISPSFAQKVADQLGYQGDIQNKADGTMSDFAKQVNDVYGGMIKNQAKPSNQKAKDTPQPSKTEVYADELEKWVANTKSAAEFARSVTGLRDSQLPNGVNVDFYNFIAQAIGAKSPQTIGFRIKLEEYWQQKNTQPTNVKEGIEKARAEKSRPDDNNAKTSEAQQGGDSQIESLVLNSSVDDLTADERRAVERYMLGSRYGVEIGVPFAEQFNNFKAWLLDKKQAKPTNVKEGIAKTRAKKQTAKAKPSEPKYSQMGNGQDDKSAFDSNNNDIRYSQTGEYTPDLIVTHNLTADAIIHADKIGGLPFASIAITKQDNPLTGFGEVTLIGDKNLIDPKGANKAKVFGSDIYSPRYPRVVVKADSKKLAQFNKDLEPARQVIESSQQISEEDFAGKYNVLNDNLVKLHFLQQNGINIERKYREVEEEVNGNKDQIDSAKADVKSLEQFADAFGVDSVEQYLAQATDSKIYTKVQDIGENNPDAFDAIFKTLADAKVERSPFKTRVRMVMDNIRMSRGKTGNYLIGSLQSMAGVVSGRTQLVEDGVRKKQVFDYSDTINQIDKALTDNNLEQAFNDYIDNVRSDLVVDERLDNGVTSTGARRTVAHTIENVVKKLKKDLRGGESFNYGLPSIRAKVTPQFKTVQQIQESKDKIITSEQFDLIKKEIDDEMSALSDKLGLESYLDIGDFLADVIDNGADKAFDFFNVKNSVPNKKLVADFLAKLKDMPTTYFEVKAKEVTQFSDFTGAVVPNSISHKARNILEQAGLKLYTYGSNIGVERADAIKQATTELNNANGNILFSQTNDTESKLRSELQSLITMQKQASQGLSLTERANSKQLREIIRRIDETKSELQRVLDQKSQPMQSNSDKENLIVSEYTGSRTVYHGTKAAVADEIMQNGIKFGAQLNDGDYRGGGHGVIQNSTSASLDPNVSKNFSNDAKPSIVKIQLADDAKIITVENEMYAEDLEDYADELKGVDAVYLANNGEQEVVILNKDKVKVVESRGFNIRDAIPSFSVLNRSQVQNQSRAPSNQANRTKSNQTAVQNITKTLSDKFGKATIDKLIADGNLEIIDFAEAKRRNPKTPSNADGYYADGKAVLIADNLSPDMIIPTFLHELGGHGGLQTLMSDKAYQSLLKEFDRMVAEGNQLAKDAKAFADATSPNAKVAQDEYLPYLISLAAKVQGNNKVKSMLNRIVMAVKSFIRDKFGVSLKVTPADIVALAEKMVSERAMQGNVTASMPAQYSKQTPQTEIDQVRKQYEGTDQWMKAPNGKPTNLTEQQWLQVRTPSFKAWFGDWENNPKSASKVIDKNGEPLVVYHGTVSDKFTVFNKNKKNGGIFFTSSREVAKGYSGFDEIDNSPMQGELMPVFLSIKTPSVIDAKGANWYNINGVKTDNIVATTSNHDGVVMQNVKDGITEHTENIISDVFVAYSSNQIKSATDNIGTFNPENDDIRYSQMGGSQAQQNKLRKALAEFFKNPLSFAKTVADNKYTDNLGKALALLGRRQLVDIYKKDLPPIKEYSDIVEQMDADSNEKAYEADKLVKEWGKLKDELPLAELMHDATLKGIDPAEAYQTGDDRAIYQQLRRRYDALSPDAKRIYKQARDDYKAQQRSVFEAIKGRIQRTDMSAPRQAELIRKMEQGFFFGQKVYFPLARFGNYVVAVKDAAGNIVSVSRAETKGQADELRKELIAQYPNDKVGRVMLDKEFVSSRDGVTRGFMSDLFDAVDKLNISSQERAEFEDTLGQLYLNSLPDISFAKSGMHRKGTPGFSQNARRAYAQHMSRGSHYIAKMRHSDVLQAKLDEMQEYVKAQGEADPNYDQPKMQRVVDEMEKRHESLMNNHTAGWSSLATSVGFMWYMGLSPASALVNLSQTALVAYPIMGAKWGFSKAGKELLIASGQASKALNNLQSSLSGDEKTAFDEAVKRGVIDMTQAHDLAGVARGEDDSVMWKIRKPMEWASFMFHHAEKFNRQVTFVASYRLAKQSGANHKQAIEQAIDATYEGHFSYAASNRPRIMQGDWARVFLLFKQYGQNMVYSLSRNAYLSAKGDKQAMKTLAGMLALHGTFAGVLGLPLATTLLGFASALGGDDDEPWDAEIALRNYLAELLGDGASEVISKGLPRALGIDLSSRVGLDSLILPRMQEGLEGQRAGESFTAAMTGPVAGIGVNAIAGFSDIQKAVTPNEYLIGTEKLMPKAFRDLVKTYRLAAYGNVDKTGIEIVPQENISLSDVGQQALGFRSGKIAQAQEGKSAIYKMDKEIGSKRQRLMNRYAKAYMAGDAAGAEEAWQDIKRFNAGIGKDYPKLKITKPKLMQSIKQRRRRIEDAEDGIYLPSSREASRQYGSFATE